MPREIFQEEREITRTGLLLVITGPTGSGKNAVGSEISKRHPEFSRIITYTTRPPRENEIPGVHYHFVKREEFLRMQEAGEFVETAESYPPHLYGSPKRAFENLLAGQNLLLIINPPTAATLDEKIYDWLSPNETLAWEVLQRTLTAYIGVPNMRVLVARLKERSMPREERKERLRKDIADWRRYSSSFLHVVKNPPSALEETLKQVEGLIRRTS